MNNFSVSRRFWILGLFGAAVSLFQSCASTPFICRPGGAHDAGFSMAMRGESYSPSAGAVCENENKNIFKTNFESGYQEGKAKHCNPEQVFLNARALGSNGKEETFDELKFVMCESLTDVRTAYRRGVTQGLNVFCSESEVEAKGRAFGEKGLAGVISEDEYGVCGAGKISALKRSFKLGSDKGLVTFCKPADLGDRAFNEGSLGAEQTQVETFYKACPAASRRTLVQTFRANFDRGLMSQFCTNEKIEADARLKAQSSNAPHFEENFARCLRKRPDLKALYLNAFNQERRQVVAARCSYQSGVNQGQSDAQTDLTKKTAMPDYCETPLFGVYLSGYLEGWKQTKDRICESAGAYEEGIQDGRTGRSMGFVMPATCPEEYRFALERRYQEGLREGRVQTADLGNSYRYGSNSGGYNDSRGMDQITYSPAVARDLCNAYHYGDYVCSRVTSVACIEKKFHPRDCEIPSDFMVAVDACIRKGFHPEQCHRVKDSSCINAGRLPSNCERSPGSW
jgi:hypothetical protein